MPGFDGMRGGPPDFGRLGMGGAPPLAGREGMGGAAPRLLGTGGALAPGREGMAALLWRGGIRGAPGRAGAVRGGTRPSPPGVLLGVAMRRGRLGTRRGIAGAPPGMGGGADILLPRTSFSRLLELCCRRALLRWVCLLLLLYIYVCISVLKCRALYVLCVLCVCS